MKPLAILAALGSLQAIAAQVIPGKMIWVDKTTCDPWAKSQGFPSAAGSGGLFTTAYDILDKMVVASSYRVYHPTTQSPTTLPANVLAWERYRLNSTYTAFWGNNTATTSNLGGPLGVWNIANALYSANVVWGPGTETPFLMVVCDDAPYISKNSSSGKYLYTDPYHHLPVELTGQRIGTDGTTKPCALNGESGYSYDNNVKFYQNVIFCTKNFKLPLGFTSNGPTPFSSGTTLDAAGKSWLGAFYTQVLRNTGTVGIFGDYDLSFGYAASHAMRFERDSVYNPDSHKFFSIAHLFDNLFWASGVGQTSQQEYASLQKTAAGKALIAAFGLTNIAVPARGVNWAAAAGWVPPSTFSDSPLVPPIPSH